VLGGGAAASSGLDIGSVVEQIVAGGGILMAIIGLIKQVIGGGAAIR
jgi:hypothetical protein